MPKKEFGMVFDMNAINIFFCGHVEQKRDRNVENETRTESTGVCWEFENDIMVWMCGRSVHVCELANSVKSIQWRYDNEFLLKT